MAFLPSASGTKGSPRFQRLWFEALAIFTEGETILGGQPMGGGEGNVEARAPS